MLFMLKQNEFERKQRNAPRNIGYISRSIELFAAEVSLFLSERAWLI